MRRNKRIVIENLQYLVLALLIVGQCTLGNNFYFGQGVYLVANVVSVYRCFALHRPAADKVKDITCLGITVGLILFNLLK